MKPIAYERLITELCRNAGATDTRAILDSGSLTVDEVPFTLMPGGDGDAGGLYAYCDFGALPADDAAPAMQRLLEINLYLYGHGTPCFALNAATGHVLFVCRLDASTIDAARLAHVLQEMAGYARQWQRTRFLDEAAAPQQPAMPVPARPSTLERRH